MTSNLHNRATASLVGGVNSPVRAFKSVGIDPIFMSRGEGAYLYSESGDAYIDYVGAFGPHILGHSHPDITDALHKAVDSGTSFGATTALEVDLAEAIKLRLPTMEKVRFVNSGTEACMSAIRLARGYTRRPGIIKFDGCYHGHADALLVGAGSGSLTFGEPDSAGVTTGAAQDTAVLPYNNPLAVSKFLEIHGEQVAAIIVEPVCGNMGVILPKPGYLEHLRNECDKYGIVLIFDEVMTGLRLDKGGAQTLFSITPDLTCLGKIIGGGLPCGAYGGRKEIMAHLSPEGSVYQAGTLSGNPLVMAAGLAALKALDDAAYDTINAQAERLELGLESIMKDSGVDYTIHRCKSMLSLFFHPGPVTCLAEAKGSDTAFFAAFYRKLIQLGVYLPPSQFEAYFVSLSHSPAIIDKTLAAFSEAITSAIQETRLS